MKKQTRTLLFFSFLAMFFIITPVIIGYSRGYRIEWNTRKIVKIGALFIEPRPAPVELLINGKFEKKTNFVFQNIYIDSLLPKTYNLQVKKTGYHTWLKNLPIDPGLVTQIKNLNLFPKDAVAVKVFSDINLMSVSPSQQNAILVSHKTGDLNLPKVYIYDLNTKESKILFEASKPIRDFAITEILWSDDSARAIFIFENGNLQKKWLIADIGEGRLIFSDLESEIRANRNFTENTEVLPEFSIVSVKWEQNGSSRIFFVATGESVASQNGKLGLLFEYNLDKRSVSDSLAKDILDYAISGENAVYFSSQTHNLKTLNLSMGSAEPLTLSSTSIKNFDEIRFVTENIFLAGSGYLKEAFVYIPETKELKKIGGKIFAAIPSTRNDKIMFLQKYSILVYWMNDVSNQPFHKRGDLLKIATFTDPNALNSAIWFSDTDEHIIFSDANSIKIAELDYRDKINAYDIADYSADQMSYIQTDGILNFIHQQKFYQISLK